MAKVKTQLLKEAKGKKKPNESNRDHLKRLVKQFAKHDSGWVDGDK